jgi:F-type H+-transporting ATPase subunit delta
MANSTTIARPYAKAILSLAHDPAAYAQWSKMLEFLAQAVADPRVNYLLKKLVIAADVKANFLCDLKPGMLNEQGQNLVRILAYNRRLLIIPDLYQQYELLRKLAQHQVSLKLIIANDMQENEIVALQNSIAANIDGELTLEREIDPNLIGGGKLHVGDRVLDSSIQGNLKALYKHLTK